MPIDEKISEKTHQVLSEEFEDYDPEAVQKAAEEWVENAPSPFPESPEASFEVIEADGGGWQWRLLEADGSPIKGSDRTFETKGAAFDAAAEFQQSIGTAPIVAGDSR